MSTLAPPRPTRDDPELEIPIPPTQELRQLRDEVHRQGTEIRTAQRAFTIFAALALILSMSTLAAVAVKLDGTTKSTTAAPVAASRPAVAPAPAVGHVVAVGLGEFFLRPTVTAAAAGSVRFTVKNGGAVTHEFVVVRTARSAAALVSGVRADETGNVGETGDLAPGTSKTLTLNLPAGHYVLMCNLPGHYKAGQHADLTVR